MARDWSDNPGFRRYAKHFLKNVRPEIARSSYFVAIAPQGTCADVQMATEIGMAIMLDKPLIVIAPEGRHVAERLLRIADHVIVGNADTDAGREEIARKLEALTNQ